MRPAGGDNLYTGQILQKHHYANDRYKNSQRLTDKRHQHIIVGGPADRYDEVSPLASIFLNYKFEGGTSVYVGNLLQVKKS